MTRGKVKPISSFEDADLRVRRLDGAVSEIREQLSRVDPILIEQFRQQLAEETARAHASMTVLILKLSVMTEMPRYFRLRGVPPNAYLHKLLPLLDMPDEWWRRRVNRSMAGWAELIAQSDGVKA